MCDILAEVEIIWPVRERDIVGSPRKEFLAAISPVNVSDWNNSGLLARIYSLFKVQF